LQESKSTEVVYTTEMQTRRPSKVENQAQTSKPKDRRTSGTCSLRIAESVPTPQDQCPSEDRIAVFAVESIADFDCRASTFQFTANLLVFHREFAVTNEPRSNQEEDAY
jgi:hypothetical protein